MGGGLWKPMERLGWEARLLWARPGSCSTKPFPPQRPQEPFSSLFFPLFPDLVPFSFPPFHWHRFLPAGTFLSSKPKKRRAHISKERKRERKERRKHLFVPLLPSQRKNTTERKAALFFIKRPNILLWTTYYSPVGSLFLSSSHPSYNFFRRQSVVPSTPPPPFLKKSYSPTFELTTQHNHLFVFDLLSLLSLSFVNKYRLLVD